MRPRRSLLALALLASPAVAQTTWYVDGANTPPGTGAQADPYTSIQYAISQTTTLPGDTVLVQPGTYFETLNYLGKAITVRSAAGAAATILDGAMTANALVLFVNGEGRSSVFEGFTLQRVWQGNAISCTATSPRLSDCVLQDNVAAMNGAAILLENSSALVTDCLLRRNSSSYGTGGAFQLVGGSPTIERCTLEDNDVPALLCEASTPTILNSSFVDNGDFNGCHNAHGIGGGFAVMAGSNATFIDTIVADNTTGFGGGGYVAASTASFIRCTFARNCASPGGGIYATGATLLMAEATVEDNIATFNVGGGIYFDATDATIVDTVFARNLAGGDDHDGGGIIQWGGTLTVERARFEDNACTQRGGAIHSTADLVVRDSIFAGNRAILCTPDFAHQGGGVWTSGTATLENCIFSGNSLVNPFDFGGDDHTEDAGGAVYGPAVLINCVLWGNSSYDISGGAHDAVLLNSVAWSNTVLLAGGGTAPSNLGGTATAAYSNIEGSWPGTGNIDQPPRFWGPPIEDFHLLPGSPCIDAGDPASPLDPDGTRADMGIYPFDPNYCGSPFNYCTGKTNSLGCIPFLTTTGFPSATSTGPFEIIGNDMVPSEAGFMVYGFNRNQLGFHGGTLCVKAPVARVLPPQHSKATGTPPCTGRLLFGFNKRIQSGVDVLLVPGQTVYIQLRQRDPSDPAGFGDSLTDAVQFTICP